VREHDEDTPAPADWSKVVQRVKAERRAELRAEAAIAILPALITRPIDDRSLAMQALQLDDFPSQAVQLADQLLDALDAPPAEPIDLGAALDDFMKAEAERLGLGKPDIVPTYPETIELAAVKP
jgi:hypothetical protein